MWNFHITAFCFYSQFVQCPNFLESGLYIEIIKITTTCNKITKAFTTTKMKIENIKI